jgi:hypothetical protein
MNACGLPAWQALGAQSSRDCAGLRVGDWGSIVLVGLRSGCKDQRSHGLWSSGSADLQGGAWLQCPLFF